MDSEACASGSDAHAHRAAANATELNYIARQLNLWVDLGPSLRQRHHSKMDWVIVTVTGPGWAAKVERGYLL
jgi:hypothetical protein